MISKLSTFQSFPKLGQRGFIKYLIFSKIKIVIILRGGGQENYGLFPVFGTTKGS